MIGWLLPWIQKHWSSLAMGLLLCWISIGVTYSTFLKRTVKVGNGGTYVEAPSGYQPTLGIAAGGQFFGCSHSLANIKTKSK